MEVGQGVRGTSRERAEREGARTEGARREGNVFSRIGVEVIRFVNTRGRGTGVDK